MSNSFFVLPTELRLEVYRHLVAECLNDGSPADVYGIFLSCRKIYKELNSELIAKVHPLFSSKHEWEKSGGRLEPIRLSLDDKLTVGSASPMLRIELPIFDIWSPSPALLTFSSFKKMLGALRPTLHLPWHTVTVSFLHPEPTILPYHSLNYLFHTFIKSLDVHVTENVHRIVLDFGNAKEKTPLEEFKYLSDMFTGARLDLERRFSASKTVRRGWICQTRDGEDRGYNLVLDLKMELEEPKRVLWSFFQVGDLIKAKRKADDKGGEITDHEAELYGDE
jgi:hypothetical protein